MLFLSVANPADRQLGALDQSLHKVRVHEPLHDDSLQRIPSCHFSIAYS